MKTTFITFARTQKYYDIFKDSNYNMGGFLLIKNNSTKKKLFKGAVPETTSVHTRTSSGVV